MEERFHNGSSRPDDYDPLGYEPATIVSVIVLIDRAITRTSTRKILQEINLMIVDLCHWIRMRRTLVSEILVICQPFKGGLTDHLLRI